jgi:hypothetical protein
METAGGKLLEDDRPSSEVYWGVRFFYAIEVYSRENKYHRLNQSVGRGV